MVLKCRRMTHIWQFGGGGRTWHMPDNLNDWSPEVWGWKILVACIVMTLALSAVCLSSGNVFVSNCWQQYWLECVSDGTLSIWGMFTYAYYIHVYHPLSLFFSLK